MQHRGKTSKNNNKKSDSSEEEAVAQSVNESSAGVASKAVLKTGKTGHDTSHDEVPGAPPLADRLVLADSNSPNQPEVTQSDRAASEKIAPAPSVPGNPEDTPTDTASATTDPGANESLTDQAIDDIILKESDAALDDEDETIYRHPPSFKKPNQGGWFKRAWRAYWHSSLARWATSLIILAAIVTSLLVPKSRYYILNTAGVRSTASLTIIDQSTLQPLKNVEVSIAGHSRKTNNEGTVKLSQLELGPAELTIKRRAFLDIHRSVVIDWGTNPLGEFSLKPVGNQYTIMAVDFLSDKPLMSAQASVGESNALADQDGKIVMTLDRQQIDNKNTKIKVTADGYRAAEIALPDNTKTVMTVKMVATGEHVFISRRNGNYDVYKANADGTQEQLLLAATGYERSDTVLAPNATQHIAALVSTRGNMHDTEGNLLRSLLLIDVDSGKTTEITQSPRIQLVRWIGDRLVFVQMKPNAAAADPDRYQLAAYDFKTDHTTQLAQANYFNDVVAAKGQIYYAPASAYQKEDSDAGLFRINPDGSDKLRISGNEVWSIVRTDYDTLYLSIQEDWYSYKVGGTSMAKADPPAAHHTRLYANSPDGTESLWVDERDGKGALILHDVAKGTDKVLLSISGLQNPVTWFNDSYVMYRVVTSTETADYILNIHGGEPQKIADVTNVSGIDQYYNQ